MSQIARPISDVSIGSWTGSPTNTVGNRYTNINETVASDTEFVKSPNNPSSSSADFGLTSLTDPISSSGHTLSYRYQRNVSGGGSNPTIVLTITLLQGTTTIASNAHTITASGFTDGSFTLTGTEADSITDYTNLRVRFTANKTGGSRTAWGEVSWVELQVPNVSISRRRINIT